MTNASTFKVGDVAKYNEPQSLYHGCKVKIEKICSFKGVQVYYYVSVVQDSHQISVRYTLVNVPPEQLIKID